MSENAPKQPTGPVNVLSGALACPQLTDIAMKRAANPGIGNPWGKDIKQWQNVFSPYGEQCADTDGTALGGRSFMLDQASSDLINALTTQRDKLLTEVENLRRENDDFSEQFQRTGAHNGALRSCLDMQMAEITRLRCLLNMTDESTNTSTPDNTEAAVQRRVDGVVDDLWNGRTTAEQRRKLGGATERANRVTPASDAGLGRAVTRLSIVDDFLLAPRCGVPR